MAMTDVNLLFFIHSFAFSDELNGQQPGSPKKTVNYTSKFYELFRASMYDTIILLSHD